MEAGRWSKIEELFNTACALSIVNRQKFLQDLSLKDFALSRELSDLLELDELPHDLLDCPLKKFEISDFDLQGLFDLKIVS